MDVVAVLVLGDDGVFDVFGVFFTEADEGFSTDNGVGDCLSVVTHGFGEVSKDLRVGSVMPNLKTIQGIVLTIFGFDLVKES